MLALLISGFMYNKMINSLNAYLVSFLDALPDIIVALFIFISFFFLGKMLNSIFRKRIQHRWKDKLVSSFLAQVIKWTFYLTGFIIALDVVGFGKVAASMVAGVGVSAIIFGFAFKDIAENFLAGILIALNRPFKVGDIIEIGSKKGPVKSIDLRNTHIRTVDGRDIYIPNAIMIKDVLTNYTKDGLIRLEFIVGLDQNDDLEKARDLIISYIRKQKDILKEPKPNVLTELIGVSSVDMKVFFWFDLFKGKPEEQSQIGEPLRSRVMREVKDLLLNAGFNLPSTIIEHKMYKEDGPLAIEIRK